MTGTTRLTGPLAGRIAPRAVRVVVAVAALGLAAACDNENTRVTFDGERFRGGAKSIDRSAREDFEVTVRQVSKSEQGARQAASYEATKYCIRWFGISTVEWETAPDAEVVPIENDVLTLRGRCIE